MNKKMNKSFKHFAPYNVPIFLDRAFLSETVEQDTPYKKMLSEQKTNKTHKNEKTWGKFHSKEDYLDSLYVLNNIGTELTSIRKFIEKLILPSLKNKHSFIDIGVGDGSITNFVGCHFANITLVDPAAKSLENVSLLPKQVAKINQDILYADLGSLSFDFILLSHVLYYIPEKELPHLLQKLYNRLNEGGCMTIIVSEGLDKDKIINHFTKQTTTLESKILHYADFANNILTYHSTESINTTDINNLMDIASIFLNDRETCAETFELKDYLKTFYKPTLKAYELKLLQKYIVIRK